MLALSICGLTSAVAQDQAAIEAKINKMAKESSENMVKGVFTTDQYAPDAISMPNNAPILIGLDAIKANMAQMQGFKFDTFTTTPTKVMVNGKMVTEIGTYALSMTVPNAPGPVTDKGKYLTIWETQGDGNLKIKVEIWNTDVAPY